MYAQMLGPGHVAELHPPSADGVEVGYSHEYVARQMGQRNLYGYAGNDPVNLVDSTGLQARPRPQPQAQTVCDVRVCVKPIEQAPVAGHVFILLDRGNQGGWWVYRGGPSGGQSREGCKCNNQLVGDNYPYQVGNADVPTTEEERKKTMCQSMPVRASNCEILHNCFVKTLDLVNKCCVEYAAVPGPASRKCNSNCVASWVLSNCIRNPVERLPGGKVLPGWPRTLPRCITEPEKQTATLHEMVPSTSCCSPRTITT